MKKQNISAIIDFSKKIKFSLLRIDADPFLSREISRIWSEIIHHNETDQILSLLKSPSEKKLNQAFENAGINRSLDYFQAIYEFFSFVFSIEKAEKELDESWLQAV